MYISAKVWGIFVFGWIWAVDVFVLSSEKLLGCCLYTCEIILHSLKLNHHNHMPNPYPIKINPKTKSQILNSPLSLPGQSNSLPENIQKSSLSHTYSYTQKIQCAFAAHAWWYPDCCLCSSPLLVCHIKCSMWCSLGATCQKGLMPISGSFLWLARKINTPLFSGEIVWSKKKKTTQTHNPYTHTALLACSLPRTPCCPGAKLHLSTCT